jgi:hypothetical protein
VSRPTPENLHVQLVAMDHETVFAVILYAYELVSHKNADPSILYRGVLGSTYRPDPDEINRLRKLQAEIRDRGADDAADVVDALEARIQHEYGRDRKPSLLAKMELDQVLDAGVRWSVYGKRGPTVRISPELIGLLGALHPDDVTEDGFPAFVEGVEAPETSQGLPVFSGDTSGMVDVYRPPESVVAIYKKLSFVDRPTLDAAIDQVVGTGPDAEETATWLEADFEALTHRYEVAAAQAAGIHYRYS